MSSLTIQSPSQQTANQSERELFRYGHLSRYRQRCGGRRGGRIINSANGKADRARDQHRTERIVLYLLRNRLRAVTESVATVLISVFGVADGGIRSFARCILGLAVQVLRCACRLADAACCLGLCVAGDIADGALDLTASRIFAHSSGLGAFAHDFCHCLSSSSSYFGSESAGPTKPH